MFLYLYVICHAVNHLQLLFCAFFHHLLIQNHSQIAHVQQVEDVSLQPLGSCVNQAEGSITFTICFNS